ncbi:response regulator transcription factor [Piscinibacter sakaiensis]|uniref:response regulator transcription factor n=1 Tax=Piscinibacter sakaiensis TaxID=1547922 RepID=UPI003727A904
MKVLLIDDHPLILAALQQVIQRFGDAVEVIGVGTARAAREVLQAHADVDLVLLDLQLGDADGFEVLGEFRSAYPAVPVVVVSASDRASDVIRSIDCGAMGFVPKRASNDTLYEALHMVMSGGIYVPPMSMGGVGGSPGPGGGSVRDAAIAAPFQRPVALDALSLTPRQKEVLALNLSVETVKDHVAAVLRALNVSSRTQAVLAVSQMAQGSGLPAAWRAAPRA